MRQFLEGATGVDMYLTASLLLFVLFFATVILLLFKTDKQHIDKMRQIPLND